jgi:hypothetical protein
MTSIIKTPGKVAQPRAFENQDFCLSAAPNQTAPPTFAKKHFMDRLFVLN